MTKQFGKDTKVYISLDGKKWELAPTELAESSDMTMSIEDGLREAGDTPITEPIEVWGTPFRFLLPTDAQPYALAVEAAKKKWPVTERTKITILDPRYTTEAPPLHSVSGAETIEIDAEWLTPEWAGNYLSEWDELIIGRIRKRERWEIEEGEPDWAWD
jgi:hypothetical protein